MSSTPADSPKDQNAEQSADQGAVRFSDLGLPAPIMEAIAAVGYETPSPIQAATIPTILQGRDILGQAQTGTGKTAAFALPLLARVDVSLRAPQVLVLAPTRELAIQVAEAFQAYAAKLNHFHVLPIYGGQDYRGQLKQLERGAQVIVGTPGRVMDHMRRGSLKLDRLQALVLDEADEMLRMGFIEDVEWILEQTPDSRQICLFSATMPNQVKRIAQQHLQDPAEVTIKVKTATADTIRQRYWFAKGASKLDALTRILDAEPFDGMIIFVRTRNATVELSEKLQARGHAAAAINGDMPQQARERCVDQLKKGRLDILIATDVAARGLDVERISHVVNFDVPYDTEAYVHRIGRTGRAGRSGDAILFITHRERRMLANIERATRQRIERMELPSVDMINDARVARFKDNIQGAMAAEDMEFYRQLVCEYLEEKGGDVIDVAAALVHLSQGGKPLLLKERKRKERAPREDRDDRQSRDRGDKPKRDKKPRADKDGKPPAVGEVAMERFRIAVGHDHGVQPGNIVGAIANEAGIDSEYIGRIDIRDDHSFVDLPEGMPRELLRSLKKAWVSGQRLQMTRVAEDKAGKGAKPTKGDRNKPKGKIDGERKPRKRDSEKLAHKGGDKERVPRKRKAKAPASKRK